MRNFYYTYVLLCADRKNYIGSTGDVERRFEEHRSGKVFATKGRLPMKLVYYEACLSKELALKRENYFKTGFGRKFLNQRIMQP
ncbi:MAG: GIY-YIG nuclease family protein [bacterium]